MTEIYEKIIVSRKKGNSYPRYHYRWQKLGFSSNRKYQEFLGFFKKNNCEECQIDRFLHNLIYGYDITIHHKDFNRENNNPENLQTLCCECHSKVDLSFFSHFKRLSKKKKKRSTDFVLKNMKKKTRY